MSFNAIPLPLAAAVLFALFLAVAGFSKRSGPLLVLAALVVVTAAGFAFSSILLA
ncbi:MAG: hypothetical protein ACO1SX_14205 [Actinomycetota bacterium]